LKLHGDCRLELDDSAIRIADNQLTHEVPQKTEGARQSSACFRGRQ